jgi:serine/threonine protein kinase
MVIIKRPRHPSLELAPEAILQGLALEALERDGILGAVPRVYDLFLFADEVRFSMEFIQGESAYEFLRSRIHTPGFQAVFLDILIQITILLECLTRRINIDHRDMKLDNIWIRAGETPVHYTFRISGNSYTHISKFQIVLLDFGFACMGSERGTQILNLGGVIPDLDPCPKSGRDMYHILNRLLEPAGFQEGLTTELRTTLHSWLHPYGKKGAYLTHLTTSHPEFGIPQLMPLEILRWWVAQSR